jgi:hypothetical protein
MIHSTGSPVCISFGLTSEEAKELVIRWVKDDWTKLIEGKEAEKFTVGHIYKRVLENGFLRENEKCFLCCHVAQHWQMFSMRYAVDTNNHSEFMRLLGYGK